MRILVVTGPNLNLLGQREPDHYGRVTLDTIHSSLDARARETGHSIETFQSNHEGALIDCLQNHMNHIDGAILNAGGLTHSSVSLRDTVALVEYPVIEVHISNIFAREEFRHHSYISPVAHGIIAGFGWKSYLLGLEALIGEEK